MIKKIKFINLMPPILAVLIALILFIVACGNGDVEDIRKNDEMGLTVDEATKKLLEEKLSSVAQGISHQQGGSSSSKVIDSLHVVTCKVVIDTGSVDILIPKSNRPKVECATKANPDSVLKVLDPINDVQWFDNPVWGFPEEGTYSNIKIEVLSVAEFCKGLTATCSGTFRVCPSTGCPSSSSVASSSSGTDNSSSSENSSSSVASSSSAKVTLECTLPPTLDAGATISPETQRSYLKCSNTNKPPETVLRWLGTDPLIIENNQVPMAIGEYTDIVVIASCGDDFLSSIRTTCNKVYIIAAVASSSSVAAGTSSSSVAAGTSSSSVVAGTSSSSVAAGTSSSSVAAGTSSSSVVTITCSFATTGNGTAGTVKTNYNVNETIYMILTCSNNTKYYRNNATIKIAEGISPLNTDGWKSQGGTSYNSAGKSIVKVSNVYCPEGGVLAPEATCPELTITGGTTTPSSSSRPSSSSVASSSSSKPSSSSVAVSSSSSKPSSSSVASSSSGPKCACETYCSKASCSALVTSGTYNVNGAVTGEKCVFFKTATELNDNGTDTGEGNYDKCTNTNPSFQINGVYRSHCKRADKAGHDIYCSDNGTSCKNKLEEELTTTTVSGSTGGRIDDGYYLYIPTTGLNWGKITVTPTAPSPACTP